MTTPQAAAAYLAAHQKEHAGAFVIFNPHDRPVDDLPVIYGFNNGGAPDWLEALAIAEDGTVLGSHICSNEGYMPHDLGLIEGSRPDRQDTYQEHYPEGYRAEFIPYEATVSHPGLQAAIKLAKAKLKEGAYP